VHGGVYVLKILIFESMSLYRNDRETPVTLLRRLDVALAIMVFLLPTVS
jgi:hypothetical protein